MSTAGYQTWGGASWSDWSCYAEGRVLADMTACSPPSAFGPRLASDRWEVVPYELTDGITGNMVWASPYIEAPVLSLELHVEGWYAIFAGLFYSPAFPSTAWLRLEGDPAPMSCTCDRGPYYGCIEEVFYKVAELSADAVLHLSHRIARHASPCGISHVRLVPLTPEEADAVCAHRCQSETRRVAASIDGPSFSPRTREDILASVEIFRHTDIRGLIDEGLLDEVFSYRYNIGAADTALALDYFSDACAPRDIPFSPSKHQGFPPEEVVRDAVEAYAGGAAGVTVFNCHSRGDVYWWSAVFSRLGHREGWEDGLPVHRDH